MIRTAGLADLDALVALEQASFTGDILSRRQMHYLLARANACALVDAARGRLRGYVVAVFRRNSPVARVYTIAVNGQDRGKGVGAGLLTAAEREAWRRGCDRVRAEVRTDNKASLAMFARQGYRPFGAYPSYYEDGEDAVRVQKWLDARHRRERASD